MATLSNDQKPLKEGFKCRDSVRKVQECRACNEKCIALGKLIMPRGWTPKPFPEIDPDFPTSGMVNIKIHLLKLSNELKIKINSMIVEGVSRDTIKNISMQAEKNADEICKQLLSPERLREEEVIFGFDSDY